MSRSKESFTLTELIIIKNRLSDKLYELNSLFYQSKKMNVDILVSRIKNMIYQVDCEIDRYIYEEYPWEDKNIAAAVLNPSKYKDEE